jgi:integration host factor subunit beta
MLKSGLVRRLAEQNPHLHLKDAQKIVDAIFDEVTAALARGDRIELRGFGAFFLRTRSARPGRNPRNGTSVSGRRSFIRLSRLVRKCTID